MVHKFPTVGGSKALIHFPQKPFVVIHQMLDGLNYERFAGTSLLGCQSKELCLQVGLEGHVHTD